MRTIVFFIVVIAELLAQTAPGSGPPQAPGELLSREGKVEYAKPNAKWEPALDGQALQIRDRLRTLEQSRAMVRLTELGRLRVNELTTIEILPPRQSSDKALIDLKAGAAYFLTREKPDNISIQMPHAIGASRGTEFAATVNADGSSTILVLDGMVIMSNELGEVQLASGDQGSVRKGEAPVKTAVIESSREVQWWLYYPAILDPEELPWGGEKKNWSASIESYQAGALLEALEKSPQQAMTSAEKVFKSALLLSVGKVDTASQLLSNETHPLSQDLQRVISTVNSQPTGESADPTTATGWMSLSYQAQGNGDLKFAIRAAREVVKKSPKFGHGWARLAGLEFGFGHVKEARKALNNALKYSPRHAEAHALSGFVLSAQNKTKLAEKSFQEAINLDPALGNAWLGRGLTRIRKGMHVEGRQDLQTATALEPNRSLLRSYFAKAFENEHDDSRAEKELTLAKSLDAKDPTPWLYSALLHRKQNEINEAVRDLEHSLALNDNRRVYRSQFLLDQDRAVRSSSLANIYQEAGLENVSVREAARAVAHDYGNYAAHLFLAESYNALRDPTRFNLRYETAWFNELLLANLLSPAGSGSFQPVSFQEYSRLFETDRIGIKSLTEYRTDGQFRENATQFGNFGNTSYALDLDYEHHEGFRPNNDLSRLEWYSQFKQQLSPQDSIFFLAKYQDYESGDNFQRYHYNQFRPKFRFEESQTPILVGGYHREWTPGNHTLFLVGRLVNDQKFRDVKANQLILTRDGSGNVINTGVLPFDLSLRSEFETYSGELNQIWQHDQHTLVLGARAQAGVFESRDLIHNPDAFPDFFNNPAAGSGQEENFRRYSLYGYHTWELRHNLLVTGGLAYDHIEYPANHLRPPVLRGTKSRSQLGPKASLVWMPAQPITFRGMYSRSLGGVSFDESFRLEPTQLAGFPQSFRSLISETVAGSVSAPTFDVFGLAADIKLKGNTYIGLEGAHLLSDVDQTTGVFDFDGTAPPPPPPSIFPSSTRDKLHYKENSLRLHVDQLLGDQWAVGSGYRWTRSELDHIFPEIPTSVNPSARSHQRADLHHVDLWALYHHPSGYFGRAQTGWYYQDNHGYNPSLDSESFLDLNIFAGYKFPRQRGEILFGLLNALDENYRLNPLTPYNELPRERTFVVRLKLNY